MEDKEEIEYHVASLHKLDDAKLDEITDQVLASEKGASAMRSLMRSVMKSALRSTMKSAERAAES
jgi:hypothetical protein